ncbi:type III secretion system translocon subunit SctB [uncultured Aureimonas sp.]|uniref:type III secretion system translocon subunit SctB n=1 Tax=uncultured Aureimonas sp. TaxID=1604662 RepID=UPI0025DC3BD5|nr:type III secretion system translocon subunit SctB [uncultured Aureimonas sp.]
MGDTTVSSNYRTTTTYTADDAGRAGAPGQVGSDAQVGAGASGNSASGGDLSHIGSGGAQGAGGTALSGEQLAQLLAMNETSFAALAASGNDYSEISRLLGSLLIEFAQQQRESAMNQRSLGYEKAKTELLGQAGKLEDAAKKMKDGALTSLIVGVVTAAVSMVASSVSLGGQVKGIAKANTALKNIDTAQQGLNDATNTAKIAKGLGSNRNFDTDLNFHQSQVKTAQVENDALGASTQRFAAVGQIGEQIGGMGRASASGSEGLMQAEAKSMEADGSRFAAEATVQQQKADMGKEVQQAAEEMIRQIINFVKDLQDSEVEMMRAVTR